MPANTMPCPQSAYSVGTPSPPADPLLIAIEAAPPTPRQPEPPPGPVFVPAPLPEYRLPYHLPEWHALDCFWWSMLARASYYESADFMTQVANYAGPVVRLQYTPPAAPPAVGRAFIEFGDQVVIVIVGTASDGDLIAYLATHAMEAIETYPGTEITINSTWYERARVVNTALAAWGLPAGKPVVVLGHSSGGATAAALAMSILLADQERRVGVVTYGSPMWTTASYRTFKTETKSPQVIEFGNAGDLICALPPPFSVLDALGFVRFLFTAPDISRYGTLLAVRGQDGARGLPSPAWQDSLAGMQAVLRGQNVFAAHSTREYTANMSQWAIAWGIRTPLAPNVQPLLDIMAAMNAGES